MTRLAVVLGSIRPNRNGAAVADWVVEKANTVEGVNAELLDLATFDLPFFTEEAPTAMAVPKDPKALKWIEAISSYDAVIFVAGEYNHSVPGALKNAIDFLTPASLAHKSVGLVTYGAVGGVRSAEHLRQIMANFQADVINPSVMLNLFTDWENMSTFAPAAIHDTEVQTVTQALVARTTALASLR